MRLYMVVFVCMTLYNLGWTAQAQKTVYEVGSSTATWIYSGEVRVSTSINTVHTRIRSTGTVESIDGVFKGALGIRRGVSGATEIGGTLLAVENDNTASISILTPNNKIGRILFADPESNSDGSLSYDHSQRLMTLNSGSTIYIVTGGVVHTTIDAAGNVSNYGYTALGTGNAALKIKYVTGTTAAAEGGTGATAHGLDSTKIAGITCLVAYNSGQYIFPGYTVTGEFEYDVAIDATNVNILNTATNSGNILSKEFRATIMYFE